MELKQMEKLAMFATIISYACGLLWIFSIQTVVLKWFITFAYHCVVAGILWCICEELAKKGGKRE